MKRNLFASSRGWDREPHETADDSRIQEGDAHERKPPGCRLHMTWRCRSNTPRCPHSAHGMLGTNPLHKSLHIVKGGNGAPIAGDNGYPGHDGPLGTKRIFVPQKLES